MPPGRTRSSVGFRENKNNRRRRCGQPNAASEDQGRGAGWGEQAGAAATLPGAVGGAWGRRALAARGSPGAAASAPAASAASAARAARLGDEEQDAASAGPGPNGCGYPGAGEPGAAAASGMDQCVTVERELEKVLHKFSGYGQLCERGLEELIDYTGGLKHEILQSHGRAARVGARGRARPLGPRRASRGALWRAGSPPPPEARRPPPPQPSCDFSSCFPRTCPDLVVN